MEDTALLRIDQQALQGRREEGLAQPEKMERRRRPRVTPRTLKSRLMEQVNQELYRRIRSVFGIVPSFLERPEDVRSLFAYQPPD